MAWRTLLTLASSAPRFVALRRGQWVSAAAREREARRRLVEVLRVARTIPFYAERIAPSADAEALPTIPELTRAEVPSLCASVLEHRPEASGAPTVRTSGSSGAPITLLFDDRHQRGRFAARALYLWENGWRPHRRSAWMLSILPGSPDGDLTRSRVLGGARFFPYVFDFARQADWLERFDPVHLYAMPSNLEGIVRVLEGRGVALRSLRGIFTGGEVLEDSLRDRVRRVLGVPIADDYGTTEAFVAWQCPDGGYHVNDQHVFVEIVDAESRPVAPGAIGRVLFTTLENHRMPLVRYAIDDYAEAVDGPCRCGRTSPRIGRIHGRAMNLFRERGGGFLSPWKLVEPVHELPGLRRGQVIQQDYDRFVVRIVTDEPVPDDSIELVRARLLERIGRPAEFLFERVDDIPRTARGKFMAARCEMSGVD